MAERILIKKELINFINIEGIQIKNEIGYLLIFLYWNLFYYLLTYVDVK